MSKPNDIVKRIKKAIGRKFSPEDTIRTVLEGLRGEIVFSELHCREGIAASIYHKWSKASLEADEHSLARAMRSKHLKSENNDLKKAGTNPKPTTLI